MEMADNRFRTEEDVGVSMPKNEPKGPTTGSNSMSVEERLTELETIFKKKGEKGKEKKTTLGEKVKSVIVVAINPKFRKFNKPLLLACLVGFFSFLILIGVFSAMMDRCESKAMSGKSWKVFSEFYPKNLHGCIQFINVIHGEDADGKERQGNCVFDNYEELFCDKYEEALIENVLAYFDDKNEAIKAFPDYSRAEVDEMMSGMRQGIAQGPKKQAELEKVGFENCVQTSGFESCVQHEDRGMNCLLVDAEAQVEIVYTGCPSPLSSLGSALGYWGTIEIVISVICIFILTKTGVISVSGETTLLKELGILMKGYDKEKGDELMDMTGIDEITEMKN